MGLRGRTEGERAAVSGTEPASTMVDPAAIGGRWANECGSTLELELHDDGRVTGFLRLGGDGAAYRPHPVAGRCQTRPDGTPGVVGSAAGWPTASTVTVWCAELGDEMTLQTHWLAPIGPDTDPGWSEALGGGLFRRQVLHVRQVRRRTRRSA